MSPGANETSLEGGLARATWWARLGDRVGDRLELTKPRIVAMVLVVTTLSYLLARKSGVPPSTAWLTLPAVGGAAGGAATLNNYRDREADGARSRTRERALPAGRVSSISALVQGLTLVVAGVAVAALGVGLLTSLLLLLATCLYVLVYTPLRGHPRFTRFVGAVAGAIPALCGWAAAGSGLGAGAWAVFALLFAWQYPHAEVVSWMSDRQDDAAARGGLSAGGGAVAGRLVALCLGTVAVSLLPVLLAEAGSVYVVGAALFGLALLITAVRFALVPLPGRARALRIALVMFLPLILVVAVAAARLPV